MVFTKFMILVGATLAMGIGVIFLLNKWFRDDLRKCTTELSAATGTPPSQLPGDQRKACGRRGRLHGPGSDNSVHGLRDAEQRD